MQNTHNIDQITWAIMDLVGFLNSPRRDDLLLQEANVSLDRALFPHLVRLGALGSASIGDLADLAGRDQTTVSRQVSKLEALGYVVRRAPASDRRVKTASLTAKGAEVVTAITDARRRLLSRALAAWTEEETVRFAAGVRRFVEALAAVSSAGLSLDLSDELRRR